MKLPCNSKRSKLSLCFWLVLALIVVLGVLLYSMAFIVPEAQIGVLQQHQRIKFLDPGLHWKPPFAHVDYFAVNRRLEVVSGLSGAALSFPGTYTIDVVWQPSTPLLFWQETHNKPDTIKGLFTNTFNAYLSANASNPNLWTGLTAYFIQDQMLAKAGIQVSKAVLTQEALSQSALDATYQGMQGLATQIAQNILQNGAKAAEAIRATGDQSLLEIEGKAASSAAAVIAAGQTQAIEINAPLYHQNPRFFKLLVNTKAALLQKEGT